MKRKTLFLKWCIINLVSTTIITVALVLAAAHLRNVSSWTIGFAGVIALVYVIAQIHAGVISWKTDTVSESGGSALELRILRHSSQPIEAASNVCPLIGLLGTVLGVIIAMGGLEGVTSHGFENAKSDAMSGVGVALISTAAGIYAFIILFVEHCVIKHAIDMPISGKTWL